MNKTTSAQIPSITSISYKRISSHSPSLQQFTTSLHGFTQFPRRRNSGIKRFRPRLTQKKDSPQKFSARLNSLRNSSPSRDKHDSQNSKVGKAIEVHGTSSNVNLKKSSKYAAVVSHAHRPSLRSSRRTEASKTKPGTSFIRKPWWTTVRSTPLSTNSSGKYIHKWHKTYETEKGIPYSIPSNLKTGKVQHLSKRLNKRKYKPRNYVPKASYNTRSPLSSAQAPADKRSVSYMSLVKQNIQPINAPASLDKTLTIQDSVNSPAAADDKPHIRKVNAAASADEKTARHETQEVARNKTDTESTKDDTLTLAVVGEDSKKSEISVYKSPVEKYDAKRGKCSSSWCKLPACRCIGSHIPGDLEAKDIPQMVMLTFDDSINSQNTNFYKDIFNGTLKNPNGCPIKSTFFVSGDNSDYHLVKKMYKQGHEIASHTLSHRSPTTWWADAGYENWEQEVVGMRDRLHEKSGVPVKEIAGMRAPFLQVGGDGQYAMLKENKFRYDSSMVTGYLYTNNQSPIWPFTLDTPPDRTTCNIPPCPTRSYPGLWEVPLVRWYGSNKIACAMPDACTVDSGIKNSRKFMEENFNRHYKTNRAPFGIFIHASWFSRTSESFQALKEFLTSLADKEDVWVVTINQALDWIQRPVRLSALNAIESWAC